jgi:hypothetical protein
LHFLIALVREGVEPSSLPARNLCDDLAGRAEAVTTDGLAFASITSDRQPISPAQSSGARAA